MMLWFILTAMLVAAAIGLTVPLVRRYDARRSAGDGTVAVLKEQLSELDARAAAEAIPPEEAEGMRTEIKRRILAEGGQADTTSQPLGERALLVVALGMIAIVVLGGTALYLKFGRPDLPGGDAGGVAVAPAAAASDPAHPGGGDTSAMIGQLEAKLKGSPNDPEGWRMLGWSYIQTGRYADAANAYGRAASLDPKAEYLSAQGEALVQAANGQVTPDALAAFKKAVAADPTDPRSRYFLAVNKDQQGDHKGAMADWITLLKSAPPDAPWAGQVRTFVIKIASERGVDVTGQLPPAPAGSAAAAGTGAMPAPAETSSDTNNPGPTPDQVAQASQMAPADQQAMIQNMVEGLDTKLKASPRDPNGWVRLMRARMVLNQPDAALAAFHQAMKTYGNDSNQQAAFKDAAHQLGIPGA